MHRPASRPSSSTEAAGNEHLYRPPGLQMLEMPFRYLLLGVTAVLCATLVNGRQLVKPLVLPAQQSPSTPDVSLSIAAASINSAIETYTAVGALAWTGKVPGNINTSIFEQVLPVANNQIV